MVLTGFNKIAPALPKEVNDLLQEPIALPQEMKYLLKALFYLL